MNVKPPVEERFHTKWHHKLRRLQISSKGVRINPNPSLPFFGPFVFRPLPHHRKGSDILAFPQDNVEEGGVVQSVSNRVIEDLFDVDLLQHSFILKLVQQTAKDDRIATDRTLDCANNRSSGASDALKQFQINGNE